MEKKIDVLDESQRIQTALAMVGLNFDLETSWLIYKTMVAYEEKKGSFSVQDAVFIYVSTRKIFGTEKNK